MGEGFGIALVWGVSELVSDLVRGNQLLRSGKLEEAVDAFQKAIAHHPHFHWSHYKLGESLAALGRWEEAADAYKKAVKYNPDFSWAYQKREETLNKLDRWKKAVRCFRKAIGLNPNVQEVLANLEKVSWKDLRAVSNLFPLLDDHSLYESMLLKCDPNLKTTSWLFKDEGVSLAYQTHKPQFSFIGKGKGAQTLNCYRKIDIGDVVLFEKVYLSGSDDVRKIVWFYDFIYPHLSSEFIKVPKLRAAKFSKECTILLTDYIGKVGVSKQEALLRMIELVNYFIELSKSIVFEELPPCITDFRREPMYRDGIKSAIGLGYNPSILKQWEQQVDTLTKVITHGDLQQSHLHEQGYVIDWDRMGMYPIGYDIACYLSKFHQLDSARDLELFLKKNFVFDTRLEWENFLFSASFFLFVHASRKGSRKKRANPDALLTDLYSALSESFLGKKATTTVEKPGFLSKEVNMENDKAVIDEYNLNRVKALLDYTKTTKQAYSAKKYPAGYHTIDILGHRLMGRRNPQVRFDQIPIDFNQKSVLDIGSNQGGMLLHISEQLRWGVGLDFEPKLVNASNLLAKLKGASHLSFYSFNLDLESLDLIPNFFPEPKPPDVVLLLAVIGWIKNWAEVIDWVAALGSVLVFEANRSSEIKQRHLAYIKEKFSRVQKVASESIDDPQRKNRQMYVCSHD
ncbi:Tetratricopeptide TPR_2 repeat protein [Limnospira maxima CS-328]|uniref:Tetratricopeptide TPR_2 repeat protein n=5 Tax=Limnospira maxima TaxID=129910 RepID=B5W6H9_LIMMA|nr:Tetratricopeptide TPR_2 repeat protein [Limnospira maxima CS-328]MDC0838512.1 tetratricopeptide repeat protein [Limnoraphis robusta]